MKLPLKTGDRNTHTSQQPEAVPETNLWRTGLLPGSYLGIRDLGDHRRQAVRQQHSPPAQRYQPRRTLRLIPCHSSPLSPCRLPCPLSPSLSFSLFACLRCRRTLDRTTMALGDWWWLWCWLLPLIWCTVARRSPPLPLASLLPHRNTQQRHQSSLQAAQNCSTTMEGANPAVGGH